MAVRTMSEMIKETNDRAKRERRSIAWFFKHFPQIISKVAEYEDRRDAYAWFSTGCGGTLSITLDSLDGFKGDELLELLFWVETELNVELTGKDYPQSRRKVFTASKHWALGVLDITISAELRSDSTSCKRVQVGVTKEVVEHAVYELRCEGDEA